MGGGATARSRRCTSIAAASSRRTSTSMAGPRSPIGKPGSVTAASTTTARRSSATSRLPRQSVAAPRRRDLQRHAGRIPQRQRSGRNRERRIENCPSSTARGDFHLAAPCKRAEHSACVARSQLHPGEIEGSRRVRVAARLRESRFRERSHHSSLFRAVEGRASERPRHLRQSGRSGLGACRGAGHCRRGVLERVIGAARRPVRRSVRRRTRLRSLSPTPRAISFPLQNQPSTSSKLWPEQRLVDCRKKNAERSDLSQYNTSAAIDDLDDLRAALGYQRLIFDVGSYGTFTALVYMRRHPESVESAVLQGVAPPGIVAFARDFAAGSQVSLDRLSDECARDARCRAAFPNFREQFLVLLHRFANGPVPVRVQNDATDRKETVLLSRGGFRRRDSPRTLCARIGCLSSARHRAGVPQRYDTARRARR